MKKDITIGTKITFTATGEKYSIIEKTSTGFMFKPIKFQKGLPTEPRTFDEIKNEFLSGDIDIENFEHNDADNRLVELIMDSYIKASDIESLTACSVDLASQKSNLETELKEKNELLEQKETAIQGHLTTIESQDATIKAHEATISEQQELIQEQKDELQTKKDIIAEQERVMTEAKQTIVELTEGKSQLETQVSNITSDLEKEKADRKSEMETAQANWQAEKQKYETTIEGLEELIPADKQTA